MCRCQIIAQNILPSQSLARRLEVDFDHVYVAFISQSLISRVDGKYYHVLKKIPRMTYVIEQINLIGNDIKHVRSRSMNFYLEVAH